MNPSLNPSNKDTIVARATASGVGAIGIVRLSGPQALDIISEISPSKGGRQSHKFGLAHIRNKDGEVVDECMLVEMHGPKSFTGEDVVELHLHGARTIVDSVIRLCQEHGARLAAPGEFTLRAFLNGRLDLAQAEAVGDLIAAQNNSQSAVAISQLKGGLSRKIEEFQRDIEGILADMQAVLDFPEYPTGEGYVKGHLRELKKIDVEITKMISTARWDLERGRRVALCGAPNVGKSSLLNSWAGEERVLVDSTPGTTRDPIEIELGRGLQRWSVWDTAGMRDEAEGLEERGIKMARERAYSSDLVVWLVSGTEPKWPDLDRPIWVVGSKSDLLSESERRKIEEIAAQRNLEWKGWISNLNGEGIQELRDCFELHFEPPLSAEEIVIVKERHIESLRGALDGIERFYEAEQAGMTLDVLSYELEDAVRCLGKILGRDIDKALLDRIFSDFCIGK